MRSVNAAAQSMAGEVFEDVGGGRSGLAQLQENKAIRLIVFVIGALPQVIKLYAMRGVLGTQICASLFFVSFLIIEAVMVWLNTYRNTTQGLGGQVTDFNDFKSFLRALILCISYTSPLSLITTATWGKKGSSVTLYLFFFAMWAPGLNLLLDPNDHPISKHDSNLDARPYDKVFHDILPYALSGMVTFLLIGIFLFMGSWAGEFSEIFRWIFFLGTMAYISFILAVAIGPAATAHPREYPILFRRSGHFVFILLQILAAILTYSLKYNPVGTYKPGWTNQLG